MVNRVSPNVYSTLKDIGILRSFRGKRGGIKQSLRKPHTELQTKYYVFDINPNAIPVRITPRIKDQQLLGKQLCPVDNLIQIKCEKSTPIIDAPISLCLLNARSVNNKAILLNEYIADKEIDILALTETWLKPGDDSVVNELCPEGYTFTGEHRKSTKSKRGGGLGVVHRSNFDVQAVKKDSYRTFEHLTLLLKGKKPLYLVLIYRPPPNTKNGFTVSEFLTEFESFSSELIVSYDNLCILGDFNFHWGKENDCHASQFESILHTMDLKQSVTQSTHKSSNILDLVITRADDDILKSISVENDDISDHYSVLCSLDINIHKTPVKMKSVRKIASIDLESFGNDLQTALHNKQPNLGAEEILSLYNDVVTTTLDKHAPQKNIKLKGTNKKPWYNDEIHEQRQKRRSLERKWKKSKLEVHRQMFVAQRNIVTKTIDKAKSVFYQDKLSECDQRESFRILDGLLNVKEQKALPSHTNSKKLADDFAQFFQDKVDKIRNSLKEVGVVLCSQTDTASQHEVFSEFVNVSMDSVEKIIAKCASKSCQLDPIPTSLLKDKKILPILLPLITDLINASLQDGLFPSELKLALVIPLLKKLGLLCELFLNYRPVSNLPFVSKVIEKAAADQLLNHMRRLGLHDLYQSAYKKAHGVETATFKVKNDIDIALDDGYGMALILLDLSAAFDTIDHSILIQRLSDIGIAGTALKWFKSYLYQRKQSVVINGDRSKLLDLSTGVPQGSVLGPLLFLIYILPLADIIDQHGISRHGYADDTQLYLKFKLNDPNGLQNSITKLEACISDVSKWMKTNKLKLNPNKTEFLLVAPPRHMNGILEGNPSISVGDSTIVPTKSVRNLGAIFDQNMSMDPQISNITRGMYYHLRRIKKVHRHIDRKTCQKVVQAHVISRLDFNNALLLGVPQKSMSRLQVAQNNAARLITGASRREHITPYLKELHWLPVNQRVIFKALVMLHKSMHQEDFPQYMADLVCKYHPSRSLRSQNDTTRLVLNRAKNSYGDRSLGTQGVKKWNSLPINIRELESVRSFKKHLKTILFKEHFCDF